MENKTTTVTIQEIGLLTEQELSSILSYTSFVRFLMDVGVESEDLGNLFFFDTAGFRVESRKDVLAVLENGTSPVTICSLVNSSLC